MIHSAFRVESVQGGGKEGGNRLDKKEKEKKKNRIDKKKKRKRKERGR